jgi:hypothetical protein
MYTILFALSVGVGVVVLLIGQPAGRRTLFDPGVFTVGLFSLCYLAPTLVDGYNDGVSILDNSQSVELLSQYGFLFVLSFVIFYRSFRGLRLFRLQSGTGLRTHWSPSRSFVWFVSIAAGLRLALLYYGVGASGDYVEQYQVRQSIPTIVAQLINNLQAIEWFFVYLVFASSFVWPSRRSRVGVAFITVLVFLCEMWYTNSRSNFVAGCIVCMAALFFHRDRRMGLTREMGLAVTLILAMEVFSLRRGGISPFEFWPTGIFIPSEFRIIYGNAQHLIGMMFSGGGSQYLPTPGNSYFQAFISFVPQQLNPGKWGIAEWYVGTYFSEYAETGGGLAFGIVPEALVNWGLLSIVFQAFVVAVVLKTAIRCAHRGTPCGPDMWVLFYLYTFGQIYNLIRLQSFGFLGGVVLGFLVPYLAIMVLTAGTRALRRAVQGESRA